MRTFAGVASLPGRPLEQVVASLWRQVDAMGIYLNGYDDVPPFLRDAVGITVIRDTENQGSSAKLHWRQEWDGVYFACDDDLEYPPDYVERMLQPFREFGDGLLVTACGRTLIPHARTWHDVRGEARYVAAVPEARWINYLGGCAFAFHTSLALPEIDPPNEEEAVLSVWAQREGVPIRLIQRSYDWPKRIPLAPRSFTLYDAAAREGFATRSRIIQQVSPWQIHEPAPSSASPSATSSA